MNHKDQSPKSILLTGNNLGRKTNQIFSINKKEKEEIPIINGGTSCVSMLRSFDRRRLFSDESLQMIRIWIFTRTSSCGLVSMQHYYYYYYYYYYPMY